MHFVPGRGFLRDIFKNATSALAPLRERLEQAHPRRRQEVHEPLRPFQLWAELMERTGGDLPVTGRQVLEIGPGRSLGLGLIFLASGARQVFAVDRFRHLFWDEPDCRHLQGVLDRLGEGQWPYPERARRAVRRIAVGQVEFDPALLSYRQADGAALPMPGASVDITYSNAVLEHVHRPEVVVRELARVTRPGGDSVHEIDFRDHFQMDDRLRLLTFGEWEWQARTRLRPGYTNRWRLGDFMHAFEGEGFEHRAGQATNSMSAGEVEARRAGMHPRFRGRPTEELSTLSYWGWWRRRPLQT